MLGIGSIKQITVIKEVNMKRSTLRLLSVVLSVLLMGACFGISVFADSAAWNGSDIATGFGTGTGTESDPYLITNASELAYLAKTTNEKTDYTNVYFRQTADIDLNEKPWTPIGGVSGSFKGIYDGNGFSVKGLNCDTISLDGKAKEYAGLFGAATGATIKNLTVSGSIVRSNKFAAPIVGYGKNLINIINCRSEIAYVDGACAGGIVGRVDFSEFNSDDKNLIIACVSDSDIFTRGNVSEDGTTGRTYTYCGGIVGVSSAATIAYCTNNGDVDIIPLLNEGYSVWCGGIVGANGSDNCRSNIYFCTNNGNVKSYTSYDVSAILEKAPGTVVNTYTNKMRLGGIVGHFTNKMENNIVAGCFNNGEVAIYKSSAAGAEKLSAGESADRGAGGIIGLANRPCISTCNYTIMEPGIDTDSSGSGVQSTITVVSADSVKGEAGLQILERGNTFESLLKILVSHSLTNSYYTANEIKTMEQFIGGLTMEDFMVSIAQAQFSELESVINSVWKTREDGAPVVSSPEAAIQVTSMIAQVQELVNDTLSAIEEGGDPTDGDEEDTDTDESQTESDTASVTTGVESQKTQNSSSSTEKEEKKGCKSSLNIAFITVTAVACVGCTLILRKRRAE